MSANDMVLQQLLHEIVEENEHRERDQIDIDNNDFKRDVDAVVNAVVNKNPVKRKSTLSDAEKAELDKIFSGKSRPRQRKFRSSAPAVEPTFRSTLHRQTVCGLDQESCLNGLARAMLYAKVKKQQLSNISLTNEDGAEDGKSALSIIVEYEHGGGKVKWKENIVIGFVMTDDDIASTTEHNEYFERAYAAINPLTSKRRAVSHVTSDMNTLRLVQLFSQHRLNKMSRNPSSRRWLKTALAVGATGAIAAAGAYMLYNRRQGEGNQEAGQGEAIAGSNTSIFESVTKGMGDAASGAYDAVGDAASGAVRIVSDAYTSMGSAAPDAVEVALPTAPEVALPTAPEVALPTAPDVALPTAPEVALPGGINVTPVAFSSEGINFKDMFAGPDGLNTTRHRGSMEGLCTGAPGENPIQSSQTQYPQSIIPFRNAIRRADALSHPSEHFERALQAHASAPSAVARKRIANESLAYRSTDLLSKAHLHSKRIGLGIFVISVDDLALESLMGDDFQRLGYIRVDHPQKEGVQEKVHLMGFNMQSKEQDRKEVMNELEQLKKIESEYLEDDDL